jgi:release factor glutamine methyltransferase
MVRRDELYDRCVKLLEDKGFGEYCCVEVTWIFQDVLKNKQIMLNRGEPLTRQQEETITEIVKRRSEGYPLQYLLGGWEFYGLPFKVGEGVLIPRQDTETLVDFVINKYKKTDSLTVVDLCSGSGCIGISLEKNLKCENVICVEKSEKAAEFLRENITLNGSKARLVVADVLEKSTAEKIIQADVIVCNPPYLTAEDMENLQTEVTFEPKTALYGGEDGLDFYRAVTRIWKSKLKSGGMLIYEIGMGQEDEVMGILVQQGFENVRCIKDLCGVNRCVYGKMR